MNNGWGVLKSIINTNQKLHIQGRFQFGEILITSDNELTRNKCNDYFINIGSTLGKSISHINKIPLSYLDSRQIESMNLTPVSENKIWQLIKSLQDTAVGGYDDLNCKCLKISSQFLVKPLTHICNLSFSQGNLPEQSKIVNVIPLYRIDESLLLNNYRPALVLCVCQRSLKRLCKIWLQIS